MKDRNYVYTKCGILTNRNAKTVCYGDLVNLPSDLFGRGTENCLAKVENSSCIFKKQELHNCTRQVSRFLSKVIFTALNVINKPTFFSSNNGRNCNLAQDLRNMFLRSDFTGMKKRGNFTNHLMECYLQPLSSSYPYTLQDL